MPDSHGVLLANVDQLLTLRSSTEGPLRGAALKELGIITNGAVLCVGGKIVSVGTTSEALRDAWVTVEVPLPSV